MSVSIRKYGTARLEKWVYETSTRSS